MDRRTFVVGTLALLPAPLTAEAQQTGKVWRIGVLVATATSDVSTVLPATLVELGYNENRNLVIEWRLADGNVERLPDLAHELVRAKVDLIIAWTNESIAAAKRATTTIPIVMVAARNPVEAGLVHSLARPGGNITGTTYNLPETAGKLVEVLKEAAPRAKRITVIWNPGALGMPLYKPHSDRAAERLGVALSYIDVRREGDFTIERLLLGRPEALYVVPDPVVTRHRDAIIRFALERKLPTIGTNKPFVHAGGLLYFGLDWHDMWRRSASYVDRILRGSMPADLPVEQPTKFELVINLRTAKAIGLTIPPSLHLRANQILE